MATNDIFQPETMDFTINGSSWLSTNSDTFKTPTEEPQGIRKTKKKIKLALINCLKCADLIKEKHLYAIGENYWHKCCVRCDNCKVQLDESGFLIDNILLCRSCYNRSIHVTKCSGCKLPMQTHEVAMYALNQPYHLACFKCNYCKNLLSKGDKFVFQNDFLICKQDFENGNYINTQTSMHPVKQPSFKSDNPSENNGIRRKTKISTIQRQYLEDYYMKNSNPSIKQRAFISEELNLPAKVVQTWFCNYRTKMKMQRNNELKILNEKFQHSEPDESDVSKVKRMFQQQCFTPDQDCPTNCQISQSTEDHASPQDLSSDLSGMYNCPDIGKQQSYHHRMSRGGGGGGGGGGGPLSSNQDEEDDNDGDNVIDESTDERGLTYADLSNSCVKSIDRSIMAGFSASSSSTADGGGGGGVIVDMMKSSKNHRDGGSDFRTQSFSATNFKDISLDRSDNNNNQSKAACLTWS